VIQPPDGYEVLQEGRFVVMIRSSVKKQIEKKATSEQRAGLEALVLRYASGGPQAVPATKFATDEGWFPSHKNKKVRLEALKPWQLRAYGFARKIEGQATFIITGVDVAKKQTDAKQHILKSAGKEAVRIDEILGGR